MNLLRTKILTLGAVCTTVLAAPGQAEAGPLLDWLFHRRGCCFSGCGTQTCATPCQTCQTTCMQTCSRVVVNYVPCTAYRTTCEQVPVTTYHPVSTTDPCTGCTVTCMRPCTSYTTQMRQVPYTTYRPVYRTETYQVPVTTTTVMPAPQPCATCPQPCSTCGPVVGSAPPSGCSSCGVPAATAPTLTNYGPYGNSVPQYVTAPAGTITTQGAYTSAPVYQQPATVYPSSNGAIGPTMATPTPTPADVSPSLNPQSLQRPATDPVILPPATAPQGELQGVNQSWSNPTGPTPSHGAIEDPEPASRWNESAPSLLDDKTASSPAIERWSYSPVELASYTERDASASQASEVMGRTQRVPRAVSPTPSTETWHTASR